MCSSALDWASYYAGRGSAFRSRYTDKERLLLTGFVAELNERGKVEWRPAKHKTQAAIRFALDLVGRGLVGKQRQVNYGDGGWEALKKAIDVRDRLVHPKVSEDVNVSDAELKLVRRAHKWFKETFEARQRAVGKGDFMKGRARLKAAEKS
jgi:hypothetical protein